MQHILNSASKTVFVLITLAVIGLTAFGIMEAKDFVVLASMTFSYYFTRKDIPANTNTTTTNTTNSDTIS